MAVAAAISFAVNPVGVPWWRDAAVDHPGHFHYFGNMDKSTAARSLAALAQESRLEIFRLLVQAGPEGMAAGEIAERLDIPASTLSFHMRTLTHARLVESRHESRFIFYSANFESMNALLGYLSDNCCGGRPCPPLATPIRRRNTSGR
jgi:DNA-binding transcriptional ArsR family regulator